VESDLAEAGRAIDYGGDEIMRVAETGTAADLAGLAFDPSLDVDHDIAAAPWSFDGDALI
jgi:hypothetical protein